MSTTGPVSNDLLREVIRDVVREVIREVVAEEMAAAALTRTVSPSADHDPLACRCSRCGR